MTVILVNGSGNEHGCVARAEEEIAKVLKAQGIDAIPFWLGKAPIADVLDDQRIAKDGEKKVREFLDLAMAADGFVFGSPVYYANANGQLLSFMNRVFFGSPKALFQGKVAVAIASARRAGTVPTTDQIEHYFALGEMIVPTAFYWNQVFGNTPEEVEKDLEGLQNMRRIGAMMAYVLKLIDLGNKSGISFPSFDEKKAGTNFIR